MLAKSREHPGKELRRLHLLLCMFRVCRFCDRFLGQVVQHLNFLGMHF